MGLRAMDAVIYNQCQDVGQNGFQGSTGSAYGSRSYPVDLRPPSGRSNEN